MKSKTIIIFLILSMYGCSQNTDKYVITKQLNQISDYPAIEVNTELFTINDNQLCFMALDDMKIVPYNHFPTISGIKVNNFIASTNVFRSSMYRYGDYIYAAYTLFPIVDIISIQNKTVKRSIHPISSSVNLVTVIDNLNAVIDHKYLFHLTSCVTREGFYTLYYGDSEENIENFLTTPEIIKYDNTGDLIVRYRLKEIIYNFCIDDKGENGYFLSFDKDYNPVVLKSCLIVM